MKGGKTPNFLYPNGQTLFLKYSEAEGDSTFHTLEDNQPVNTETFQIPLVLVHLNVETQTQV